MQKHTNIIHQINPNYFWDTDIEKLDPQTSKRLIIERVFSLGSIDEMMLLVKFYGEDEVVTTLRNLNYLDPKTLRFVSLLFDEPRENFKCYKHIQSEQKHWIS